MYNYSKQRFVYFITVSIWFLPHSWLMTGFVRRWMQLVEHELLTLLKHMSSFPIRVGFMLHDHIVMSSVLYIIVCPFTGLKWCDFVLWSPVGKPNVERIRRDDQLITNMMSNVTSLWIRVIAPEIFEMSVPRKLYPVILDL